MLKSNKDFKKIKKASKEYYKSLENEKSKMNIQRFKGLGEMNAGELWDTAMNPETRTLIKVTLADAKGAMAKASDMFEVLMGNDVSKRKLFIEKNAKDVRFLDV